jgi:adenylate kinase
MGPPGAGKGTQAAHLVEAWHLRHVATGDVLRSNIADGTELGARAKSFMDRGDLVPDDVVIGMLRELVAELPEDSGVLLDGFPRTTPQAEALEQVLGELDRNIDVVLDVRVPDDVLLERLSSRWICRTCQTPYNVVTRPPKVAGVCDLDGGELYQRADDTLEAARNRLEVYARDTAAVVPFYEQRGVLVAVDGNQAPADVEHAIDAAVSDAVAPRTQ